MFWTKSAALQRANRFKASENANDAIIFSGVGNRIDMRARAHGGRFRLGTRPAREYISDRILAHRKAGFLTASVQPRARFEIRWQ